MSKLIVSVSGIRGVVGKNLTSETVQRFTLAVSAVLEAGPLIVTRDGRANGVELAEDVCRTLASSGRNVIDGGIAATPTTGVLIRELQAAGGIQISASHNPIQYNGLKLFDQTGRLLTAQRGEQVREIYQQAAEPSLSGDNPGTVTVSEDTISDHLNLVLATVDVDRIRSRNYRVLLDANHGAGGLLGRRLLETLGCQPILLGEEANGKFQHAPEPTADNLTSICQQVAEQDVVIGFCQDPDADRLAIIDASGKYLGEEYTMALCVDHVLQQRSGAIVTNCATSRMIEDLSNKYGVAFHRSAVGEANVVDAMMATEACFGGEGNGGPIDPGVGYVRDSFVGMALVLDAMAAGDQSVRSLADRLPCYSIHKTQITVASEQLPAAFAALEGQFAAATSSRLDGLRLDWPDQWLLIRASNTEPLVRLIAEASDQAAAEQLCQHASAIVQSL
ncbi:MAG: phosphoglucosamine mutase [Pirellulaceae bacterium]